ncbi:MAG: 3'-5' exonuclease, partial [Chloroflexota bacterium]
MISRNLGRKGKQLWTDRTGGSRLKVFHAYNEQDEARFVVEEIGRLTRDGSSASGCAVMYRTNAQSRALEEACLRANLPYRLVGATRFYQRREVRDVIAYLRLLQNPSDSLNLRRILNVPSRKIGSTTIKILLAWMEVHGTTLLEAVQRAGEIERLGTAARNALAAFAATVEALRTDSA